MYLFCVWLLLISKTFLRFTHVFLCISYLSLFCCCVPISYINTSLFIHYPDNGYLDCFQFLVMNKVSRSSYANIYLDIDFHFFSYKYLNHKIQRYMFNVLRSCQTIFQWLYYFILPPTRYESSGYSTYAPTLILFHFTTSSGCGMVPHYF